MDTFAQTGPTLIKDDEGKTYTVKKKSADKYIGRGNDDPTKAIAVARKAAKNQAIEGEFEALQWLADETAVIPTYRTFMVTHPENKLEQCAAYTMQWIEGIHSKSNKPAFERALAKQKGNMTTQKDLESIATYITQKATIPDLQVMLETATGHVLILDPGGVEMQGNPDHPFIKRWKGLFEGTIQPTSAEDYNKDD